MLTRHGKIARLPHEIREELNRRLFNGALSPELLPWLNEQPPVQEVLRQFFAGAPINRQNLSDWRQGGYQDWLRHQEREIRIRRIVEDGDCLERAEDFRLFEHAARIAVAELMAQIDTLHELDDETRWNRLRGLTRELVRLQNGYNRSRWRALAWTRWNFRNPEEYPEFPSSAVEAETGPIAPLPTPSEIPATPSVKVDQAESTTEVPPKVWTTRTIYQPRGCDCVCAHCHPDDSEYPYAKAVQDVEEARQRGVQCFWRDNVCINLEFIACNCLCAQCKTSTENKDAVTSQNPPKNPLIDSPNQALCQENTGQSDKFYSPENHSSDCPVHASNPDVFQTSNFKSEIPALPDPKTSPATIPPPLSPTSDFLRQCALRKAAVTA